VGNEVFKFCLIMKNAAAEYIFSTSYSIICISYPENAKTTTRYH